ncbi:MAG: TonB-dependent receptor [Dysgonomonas sp.]|nr:TonB-dependent receptor [Dysgonomonas sp.]
MKKALLNLCLLALLMIFPIQYGGAQTGKDAQIQVSGVVSDQNMDALIGVKVLLKGTNKAVVTDVNGKYSISVPRENSVLIFSYIGFLTTEKPVKGNILDVELKEKVQELDEIVVIGYGEMKKRDLTGAIASVSAKSIEEQSPVNVFDALQGQAAGVEITTSSGAPGSGANIRVRGTATFEGGASPLYVVDGVIYDNINDLNPNDVASVEILKDAASAAIYGSRSANGVILISTKQGTTETKLDINYLRSYSKLSHILPKANGAERKYYDIVRREVTGERGSKVSGYPPIIDTLAYFSNQDLDLHDLLFNTAVRDEINLRASGGTNVFKYNISAGFLMDNGIVVNSDYKRLTSRINTDYNPSSKLTIGSKIYLSYASKNGIDESNVLGQMLERPPHFAIFNPDGSYVPYIVGRRNPYALAKTDVRKQQDYRLSMQEYLNFTFNKNMKFRTSIQANFLSRREESYRPAPQLSTNEFTTGRDYTTLRYDWTNENYFTYNQTFKEVHNVDAMLGCSFQSWREDRSRLVGLDYTTDEIYTLNVASGFDTKNTYSRIFEHRMASFFGRVGYNYKSKYLFNANLRYDGSSRFGKDKRWGAFPSASVAWRFSDESLAKWMKPFLSDAKFRVSYGVTGNEEIGNYESMLLYSPNYIYENNGENVAGIGPSSLGFEGLSWEETSQLNVGLDMQLMDGRISIVTDYYKKNTDKLLNQVQLPKETGFNTIYRNVGAMTNQGFEFAIRWDAIKKKKLQWTVSFNIATNNSKITEIADGIPFYKGSQSAIYVQEGARVGEFYGYKYLGIFPYDQSNAFTDDWRQLTPIFNSDGTFSHHELNGQRYDKTPKQKYSSDGQVLLGGDVDFVDTNNDGIIDVQDKTKIGCAQPDFFGGLSSTLTYNRFSLFFSIYYSIGGDIFNQAEWNRNRFQVDGATPSPDAIRNMWTKQGDIARYPAPYIYAHNSLAPSDFYLEDASYIKLKNIKLSYSVPSKILKKYFLKGATTFVYGKNVLTFTDYKGYDPEFTNGADALEMGIDTNKYPRQREFGFGVNLSF